MVVTDYIMGDKNVHECEVWGTLNKTLCHQLKVSCSHACLKESVRQIR